MRTILGLAAAVLVFMGMGTSVIAQADGAQKAELKAEVDISAPQRSRVGETFKLTVQIKNVGGVPFYVTRAIQVFDYHGGFEVLVTPPPGARVQGGAAAGDYFGKVDITKETENFVLLVPGAIYGGTFPAPAVPYSPGTYKIRAKRIPPLIPDVTKEKLLLELRFPFLFDTIESKTISVVVTE